MTDQCRRTIVTKLRNKPTVLISSYKFPNPQNAKSKYQRFADSQIPKIPQIPKKPRPPLIDNLKSPKYKVKIPKICSFPNPQNTTNPQKTKAPSLIDNLKSPKYKVKIPKTCSFPNPQNTKSKYQRLAVSQIPKIQSQNTKDLQFPKSPKYHKSPKNQGPLSDR